MEDWVTATIEYKKHVDVVYHDFVKAFDSVNYIVHNCVWRPQRFVNWFKSFLTNHAYLVKVSSHKILK